MKGYMASSTYADDLQVDTARGGNFLIIAVQDFITNPGKVFGGCIRFNHNRFSRANADFLPIIGVRFKLLNHDLLVYKAAVRHTRLDKIAIQQAKKFPNHKPAVTLGMQHSLLRIFSWQTNIFIKIEGADPSTFEFASICSRCKFLIKPCRRIPVASPNTASFFVTSVLVIHSIAIFAAAWLICSKSL